MQRDTYINTRTHTRTCVRARRRQALKAPWVSPFIFLPCGFRKTGNVKSSQNVRGKKKTDRNAFSTENTEDELPGWLAQTSQPTSSLVCSSSSSSSPSQGFPCHKHQPSSLLNHPLLPETLSPHKRRLLPVLTTAIKLTYCGITPLFLRF